MAEVVQWSKSKSPKERNSLTMVARMIGVIEREHYYGHPWLEGRYVFDFLVRQGLMPHHNVLDVGCGGGRLGIHLLRYLEPGRYFGLDVHRKSLEAFAEYEIFLHGLEDRNARLLWTDDFASDHFGIEFDWAVDIATTLHLSPPVLSQAFQRIAKTLAPREATRHPIWRLKNWPCSG